MKIQAKASAQPFIYLHISQRLFKLMSAYQSCQFRGRRGPSNEPDVKFATLSKVRDHVKLAVFSRLVENDIKNIFLCIVYSDAINDK